MMKMRQFWPNSKAIALVFCRKMTELEVGLLTKIEVGLF